MHLKVNHYSISMLSLNKATSTGIKIAGFWDEILKKDVGDILAIRPRKTDLNLRSLCKFSSIAKQIFRTNYVFLVNTSGNGLLV